MANYAETEPTRTYALKKENHMPIDDGQRRIFHDGQFQGWEYVHDDGTKGLDIFYCFLEEYRVGQYLLSLSSISMAKRFVAGIQKWIDEQEYEKEK